MQRLRQRVEALQVQAYRRSPRNVTISAGLVVMASGASVANEKLLRADEAPFAAGAAVATRAVAPEPAVKA